MRRGAVRPGRARPRAGAPRAGGRSRAAPRASSPAAQVQADQPVEEEVRGESRRERRQHQHGTRSRGGSAATLTRLEQEGEIAADYLEGLLDIADLDGDIDMDVEGERASVSIIGDGVSRELTKLVGRDGEVLEALQELTRLAVHRETGERSRLMLDIAGFRARKRAELAKLGAEAAAEVKETGQPVKLDPMTPVRAQGRARRGGRGRAAQRVRGRGAPAPGGRPAGLTGCRSTDRSAPSARRRGRSL